MIIYYLFINAIVRYDKTRNYSLFFFQYMILNHEKYYLYSLKKVLKYRLRNKRFLRWHVYVYASHSDKELYRLLEFNESCSYLE